MTSKTCRYTSVWDFWTNSGQLPWVLRHAVLYIWQTEWYSAYYEMTCVLLSHLIVCLRHLSERCVAWVGPVCAGPVSEPAESSRTHWPMKQHVRCNSFYSGYFVSTCFKVWDLCYNRRSVTPRRSKRFQQKPVGPTQQFAIKDCWLLFTPF